jgi:predicted lipoprotein with Yx(FWY)xxD motif
MTRSRPITFLAGAAVIPLAALAVSACGGGAAAATASPRPAHSPAQSKSTSAHSATVRVAHSRLGRILVDSAGRTLYLFKADSRTKSDCFGACATAWPPLLATGTANVGTGLTTSRLGAIRRSGAARQVTYNGHPLYLFVKDQKPGDVHGQGVTAFGAAWFALSPAGNQLSPTDSRHAADSSSSPPAAPATPAAPAAPNPATQPAPPPATTTAPPAAKPAPAASSGIPQNNGGDGDADNNGGPSDGDGNI